MCEAQSEHRAEVKTNTEDLTPNKSNALGNRRTRQGSREIKKDLLRGKSENVISAKREKKKNKLPTFGRERSKL